MLISFFITLVPSDKVMAADCVVPREIVSARPDPEGTPTKVLAGIYVVDIKEIDDVSQSFCADFVVSLQWHDLRLSAKSLGNFLVGCNLQITDIWNPKVQIVNQKKVDNVFEDLNIDDLGNVLYRQRFIGYLSSPFNLREFPFDKQLLNISLISGGYSPDEVIFKVDKSRTGQMDKFSMTNWSVKFNKTYITTEHITPQNRNLSRFDFQLAANRHTGFYIWKVFLPLTLIVFMAGSVFWIDPTELCAQVSVSTASILTLIAFQFSLGYLLPRISYLTRADQFVLGSTLLVFLAMGESITASRLARDGKQEISRKIDRWSRIIYPVIFIGHSIVTLWI